MATVRVRIAILTVRITLSVCPFNRMAHTANNGRRRVQIQRTNKFKSILVLFSETFQKGRFRFFLSNSALSNTGTVRQVHSETIVDVGYCISSSMR
jgi:hypothetical protein